MGSIYYGGSATPIHFEDRALAHLQMVITTKLRRAESLTLSWPHPSDQVRGRNTLWLHPAIPLRFVLDTTAPVDLDRDWLTQLAMSASSAAGIQLTAEHLTAAEPDTTNTLPQQVQLAPA